MDQKTPASSDRKKHPVSRLTYAELGKPTSTGRMRNAEKTVTAVKKEDLEMDGGEVESSRKTPSRKSRSVKSVGSTKSVDLLKNEVTVDSEKKILGKMKEKLELQRKMRESQKKLDRAKRELARYSNVPGEAFPSPDQIKRNDDLACTISELEVDMAQEIEELQTLEFELQLLKKEQSVKLQAIDEDADLGDFSESDDDSLHTAPSNVEAWVNATRPEVDATEPDKPEPASSSSSEVTKLVDALSQVMTQQQKVIVKTTTGDRSLVEFNGSARDWTVFKEEFTRTTKEFNLTDSQNLSRLRKALKGAAYDHVHHLLPHVANVPVIMTALEKRFGQPRYILQALAKEVNECPAPNLSKPETIIKLDITVKSLVATITATKNPLFLNNMELLENLVKKLPAEMCEQWHTFMITNNRLGNLADFSEWLNIKADLAMMRIEPTAVKEDETKHHRPKRGPGAVNAAEGEEKKAYSCPVCKKTHSLSNCPKFQEMDTDSRWGVIKNTKPGLCICCLRQERHRSQSCPKKKPCGIGTCDKIHHQLLHSNKKSMTPKNGNAAAADAKEEKASGAVNITVVNNEAVIQGCDGPLPIVPAIVKGPKGIRHTYALKDSGCSRTLMLQSLADAVGLEGEKAPYSFKTSSGEVVYEPNAELVDCEIAGTYRNARFLPLKKAVTVTSMKMTPYSIKLDEIRKRWPRLRRFKGRNLVNVVPEIIIGNNNPTLILHNEIAIGPPDAPVGWRTPLGWTVSGDFDDMLIRKEGAVNCILSEPVSDQVLHELMKSSFTTDNFGVVPPKRKGANKAEERDFALMEKMTRKIGNRWETGLIWKDVDCSLPESYGMALRRLNSVEKKMKNEDFAKSYKNKFKEYLDKGYMRKLTPEEITSGNERTWYIPHFQVTNPNKPGKFRLVMDAAAKSNGMSLSDALSKGPDMIRPLPAVLWNFRIHLFALSGDIADMFHRVRVIREDLCSQRVLYRDGEYWREPDQYVMLVLIFGAASSPCLAIYVKNENAMMFVKTLERAVYVILNDFYVDDCLTGADSIEECVLLRQHLTHIMDAGGFNLCKFNSNSREVLASIPEHLRAEGAKSVEEMSILPPERVLGMWWNPGDDTFGFKLGLHKVPSKVLNGEVPTKRQACGLVMSLYDPIGLISHYKIKGIMILQKTWISGIGWDEDFPEDIFEMWLTWLQKLNDVSKVKVPRCYNPEMGAGAEAELHVFVDASKEAFAMVAYLRFVGSSIQVSFLQGKARVAPLKEISIPKMELQAAVLGSRFAQTLRQELKLKISREVFWSDSSVVLAWIRSEAGRFVQFVANRVGEIQEITNSSDWRWVPTDKNPADLATRFEKEISFEPDDVWYTGPDFLRSPEEDWPIQTSKCKGDGLVCATSIQFAWNKNEMEIGKTEPVIIDLKLCHRLLIIENFSSLSKLVRRTAAVRKAFRHWYSKTKKHAIQDSPWKRSVDSCRKVAKFSLKITPDDYDCALSVLVKWVQSESFTVEFDLLAKGKPIKKGKVSRLSPVFEDGVLRLKSRIVKAEGIPISQKKPMILPSHHHFVELMIQAEHEKMGHQGQETVLNNLRRRFWIVDGRQAVLRTVRKCPECKLRKAAPLVPEMGALPDYRLAAYQPPFTFTGLDFFGPITVTVGRRHEKRWGAIFTCLVTRAIHLEIAHALSTDEAMMASSRFIDTRGRPTTIYSDNGTNFVGASKELKEAAKHINFDEIASSGKFGPIEWRFNPPATPHFGGAWERLIKSVKKCLYSILNETFPKDTTLLTMIKSVENMVNSRPITYVSSNPDDDEALTPNHFLRGGCDAGPSIPFLPDIGVDHLREQWKRSQCLADQFWRLWIRDYLPKLMVRDKWHGQTEPIRLGDLVYIVDKNLPRRMWRRGYVSRLFFGDDGQVRVVWVTVSKKEKPFKRGVTEICPIGLRMEISGDELHKSGAGMSASDNEDESQDSPEGMD